MSDPKTKAPTTTTETSQTKEPEQKKPAESVTPATPVKETTPATPTTTEQTRTIESLPTNEREALEFLLQERREEYDKRFDTKMREEIECYGALKHFVNVATPTNTKALPFTKVATDVSNLISTKNQLIQTREKEIEDLKKQLESFSKSAPSTPAVQQTTQTSSTTTQQSLDQQIANNLPSTVDLLKQQQQHSDSMSRKRGYHDSVRTDDKYSAGVINPKNAEYIEAFNELAKRNDLASYFRSSAKQQKTSSSSNAPVVDQLHNEFQSLIQQQQ